MASGLPLSSSSSLLKNFCKGQILLLELNSTECFIGTVKKIRNKEIVLIDVNDIVKKEKLDVAQSYFESEIKSIKILRENNTKTSLETEYLYKTANKVEILELNMNEINLIENQIKKAIVITRCDNLYHQAINKLKSQKLISLIFESSKMGRYSKIDLITMCTIDDVYIFDIKFMGQIHNELKIILESRSIRKIIYDSRKASDCLKYDRKIHLTTVFDTLYAHLCISKDKNLMDFTDFIQKYLKLPSTFLICDKNINWYTRPLHNDHKKITSTKVILNFKLYNVLLHKYLLKGFYEKCKKFSDPNNVLDSIENCSKT